MKYLVAYLTLACASSAIALKCHRCGWIKDNEVLQLIPKSDERCASDPDPTMLAEAKALQYPRDFARNYLKELERNMSKMAAGDRSKRDLMTLDIKPGNFSDSDEEFTDMTPPEVQSTRTAPASSSPRPDSSSRAPIDFSDDEDDNFPMYDSLEHTSVESKSSDKSSSKSPNAIKTNEKLKPRYVKIHPVCATWSGTFRGKPFVIRDFHFSEDENVLDGKCFNEIPPQYRIIMEDLFTSHKLDAIDKEVSAMTYWQLAYCGKDGCNNGDYRKASACPASPRPARADFLKVPKL